MILKQRSLIILIGVILVSFVSAHSVFAYTISDVSVDPRNDFVLEPGKTEIALDPGETATKIIYVTSRIPGTTTFSVDVEDIQGSNDPDQPVIILEKGEQGPNSGKNFIVPDTKQFTLSFGQKISIPVTITIPKDAAPGGFYSSVLVSNEPSVLNGSSSAQNFTKVVSRLGTLFFIKVNGKADEQGSVDDFRTKGKTIPFYEKGPITFEVLFNNTGNVHLVPYGTVSIKNTFGKPVADLPIDAYFSLPHSLRYREVTWDNPMLFGRYTATLTLNRGYGDQVDTKQIVFWVIPWKILLAVVVGVFIVTLLAVTFFRTFEFRKKRK